MTALDRPYWIEARLERVEYEDTDHYQVTRNFLTRHEMMLDVLLRDD